MPVGQTDVVAFEGFNKTLGHTVTLRALERCRNWLQAQGARKGAYVVSNLARPIVGQALQFVGRILTGTKPIFNGLHHQVSNKIGI